MRIGKTNAIFGGGVVYNFVPFVAPESFTDPRKYADFAYEAQINIANLTEDDFVNVVFGVNEAVSGNYAPAIEIYSGYILVFAKVNATITIPTIEITKIDL